MKVMDEREELAMTHIDSYNFMIPYGDTPGGLDLVARDIPKVPIDTTRNTTGPTMQFWIGEIEMSKPNKVGASDPVLLPTECRERKISYVGNMRISILRELDGVEQDMFEVDVGDVPVMLKSVMCNLHGMTKEEMLEAREDEREMGGYFISNGNEKTIRLLIAIRRNKSIAVKRSSYKKRAPQYSDLGIMWRGAKKDESSVTNVIHYVLDGTATVEIIHRKAQYLFPAILLLRALKETTDREIYNKMMQDNWSNTFLSDRVELMLRLSKKRCINTQLEALSYLGSNFRMAMGRSKYASDAEVGRFLLDRLLFVNCETFEQKFDLMVLLVQKVYALAEGKIEPENPDCMECQECLLPGHIILRIIKENLEKILDTTKQMITRDILYYPEKVDLDGRDYLQSKLSFVAGRVALGQLIQYFINTGNLKTDTGIDLQQTAGFTVTADRVNFFRFISHCRAIHRGQFFTTMRTTTVRKLLPETWGFLCPVHTPDGAPCGLLTHIAEQCQPLCRHAINKEGRVKLIETLIHLGLVRPSMNAIPPASFFPVLLDGVPEGWISPEDLDEFVTKLRIFKVLGQHNVPQTMEIAPLTDRSLKMFNEVVLSTDAGRFCRPVKHLSLNKVEWVSPIEQAYMNVAVREDEILPETTHIEIQPRYILALLAACTPFSDNNQSCRNMYQCQMLKQTMGTFCHNMPYRVDNKVYRLQTPQTPISHTETYKKFDLDEYSTGTNTVVCVTAYTGYDMEDAMIVCRGAMQRGFKHGSVYKTEHISLIEDSRRGGDVVLKRFTNTDPVTGKVKCKTLPPDGVPIIGMRMDYGTPMYAYLNENTGRIKVVPYKHHEPCYIEEVRLVGSDSGMLQKISVKLRYNRNPILGDKFASRAGQKGTLGMLIPQENMPFTEFGLVPDLIINPHAFPSRMTIGMMNESIVGKYAAMKAEFMDASSFN